MGLRVRQVLAARADGTCGSWGKVGSGQLGLGLSSAGQLGLVGTAWPVAGASGSVWRGLGSDTFFGPFHDSVCRYLFFVKCVVGSGFDNSGTRSFWSLSGRILSCLGISPNSFYEISLYLTRN